MSRRISFKAKVRMVKEKSAYTAKSGSTYYFYFTINGVQEYVTISEETYNKLSTIETSMEFLESRYEGNHPLEPIESKEELNKLIAAL